ncbi:MAG TPA: hypothetical protein PKD54_14750, partial [Pirellulaceae bacterium]|nr:hypothetical protein [Pirellulaceae bacterium]
VAIPFFVTNWLAHGEWVPAYSHRQDGPVLFQISGDFRDTLDAGEALPEPIAQAFQLSPVAEAYMSMRDPYIVRSHWMGQGDALERWVLRDRQGPQQWALVQTQPQELTVRAWSNWYDYPGSYWSSEGNGRSQVDRGEKSRWVYLWHCTLGHHGFWSLTPIWLLAAVGFWQWGTRAAWGSRAIAWMGLMMTLMVLVFYVTREPHDRNYGGMTSGLRWALWLVPFWLMGLAVACEHRPSARWWWPLTFVLLALSVWGATYAWANPWVHPWLYWP